MAQKLRSRLPRGIMKNLSAIIRQAISSFKLPASPKSSGVYTILVVATVIDSNTVRTMVERTNICQHLKFFVFFCPEFRNSTLMTKDFITRVSTMIFKNDADKTRQRVRARD